MTIYPAAFSSTTDVLQAFEAAFAQGSLREFLRFGRTKPLKSFTEAEHLLGTGSRVARGIQSIAVNKIIGSVSDNRNFDNHFNPRCADSRHRWAKLYAGFLRGDPIPPIDVYKVGDSYYVEDGHHRVSVARALGQLMIEAKVIEVETTNQRGAK